MGYRKTYLETFRWILFYLQCRLYQISFYYLCRSSAQWNDFWKLWFLSWPCMKILILSVGMDILPIYTLFNIVNSKWQNLLNYLFWKNYVFWDFLLNSLAATEFFSAFQKALDGLDRIFQTFFNKLALDPTHFNNINGVEKSCFRLD